ncbi:hypothetical protein [Paraburkholderia saeva]|uniref:hypothetical protein n=1 Tax=Paraburkholderia saeva TaxID=2777537 RepID=UPI001DC19777|nr:hypothetical protein [Paraburkholderia saeva]CAG4895623.1 hypothetical protein R52603_02026 [Paraburkholderia saeva]
MNLFRILLCIAWLAALVAGVHAYMTEGMVAGQIFSGDIQALTWRGQFDIDLLGHLIVLALWVAWRNKFRVGGIAMGVLCVLGGGVVSFAYLFVLACANRGDVRRILLGCHQA